MNSKVKGVLQVLLVLVLIAAFAFVAARGIGGAHRGSAKNIRLGLDLEGGVSVTYQAYKTDSTGKRTGEQPTDKDMADTIYKMQKRVETLESTEAAVYQEGSDRVTIDIPGASDSEEVLKELGKAGALYFILYSDLKTEKGGTPNEGDKVVYDKSKVLLTGDMIGEATSGSRQQEGTGKTEYGVSIKFAGKGIKKFAKITGEHVGEQLAIVYDEKLVSAPNLKEEISGGECWISGSFTSESAEQLASTVRIGALPLELENIHGNVVGATLGSQALKSSLFAGVVGLILVIIFMIVMYRISGVAASIALIFYVGAMLLALNGLNVTLTLPGIAGIILSIGMAVDANCIIFTRIREELATGKTVASAIDNGFSKAMSAIVDGNVTTLIAALVLYLKGSGTVKGFAMTLGIGIVLSMFTALFITKLLMKAFCALGMTNTSMYGIQKERKTINFIGNWKKYVVISGAVVVICVAGLVVRAASGGPLFNYSLDFAGGNSTSVDLSKTVTDEDKQKAEDTAKSVIGSGKSVEISVADNTKIVVRTEELSEQKSEELKATMAKTFGVDESTKIESEFISGSVSDEMKVDAAVATLIATLCMLLYIWIRFRKLSTGISAVLALIHDVIAVLTVYVVASAFIPVGSTFIACMLTIVGYSINDTIVVFDRIRENKAKATSRTSLAEIINKSITETLSRSINTSVTTFIMVFVLAVFGVDSVRQFAIPLIVGIISGCYSSVCVASPLWYVLSGKGEKEQKAVTYSKKKK
ncbi:protein translocase subunit SecD [Clostridium sp. AF37-5]|uniref:protein translocase subunit SecD n=1 Tax=Clostridium sp. AF37-5 TaxID=2293016 RepID=UPI000E46AA93|nr:protein translocase subunit SecD [Clostridium sp. AF37-5]RHO96238.1 protein translocase subunit SecD [Clostridium sp. AF37-5]